MILLNAKKRDCLDIISFEQLKQKHSFIHENELLEILNNFKELGIVFEQDTLFLSLPLDFQKCIGIRKTNTNVQQIENSISSLS